VEILGLDLFKYDKTGQLTIVVKIIEIIFYTKSSIKRENKFPSYSMRKEINFPLV